MKKKLRRSRGIILTIKGWQKFQDAKIEQELLKNKGQKLTLEDLCDRSKLTTATLRKIMTRDLGVDRRSVVTLFAVFNLELESDDYTSPESLKKTNKSKRSVSKIDWGEAIDVSSFFGRSLELTTLNEWLSKDSCRLVTIIGLGGIGKTALSVKLAQQVKDEYDYVIWRSLRDAPLIQEILTNLIQFLGGELDLPEKLPERIEERISLLIKCLRSSRCLVVLDNAESLLDDNSRAGVHSEEHQEYDRLFQRIGESDHQSCLILTTREKPKQVAILEGEMLPVKSLEITGFKEKEGELILKAKGLSASDAELAKLATYYGGNPLALKIVGTSIRDLFGGNVSQFLQRDMAIFGDVRELLEQQFERLTEIEAKVMYWLGINREPIDINQLQEDLVGSVAEFELLESLESLSRRCLVEKIDQDEFEIEGGIYFTLQSVVMEYVISRLIDKVCQEIDNSNIELFRFHALMKATAKDYVKNSQIRLIVKPVISKLLTFLRGQINVEARLKEIIVSLQSASPLEPGYTAGNIINLLNYLETDLKGYDFSNLCIWQADLQNVPLHDVSLQNSDLTKTIFSQTFSGVTSITFSCDGKILAAGDSNGEIHLWRVADGQSLNILKGHSNWVTSLRFSPNDMFLVSSSSDSNIKLWNHQTGQCLMVLDEHQGEVWSVVFSPDSKMLVSGSDDRTIRLWRTSTGECVKILQEHTSWVTSLAFSSDGNMLASGSDDRTIKLWNFDTGECLKVFQGHSDGVRSVAFSPDNQTLISGSDDHTVKLWNINTGECINTLDEHENRVFSVAYSPEENSIVSGSHDQTVKLWNIDSGRCINTFEHSNWVFSVAYSPEGNIVASGSRDQTVKLWNLNNGKCLKTFQGYSNQVLSVCFSPDSQKLASGSQDKTIKLWDVATGQCLKTLQGHLNWVYSVAFSPKDNLLISGSEDKTIKLWDINTNKCLRTLKGHNAGVRSVAFSSDGNTLASGSDDHSIKLWDISTGQVLRNLLEHKGAIWSVALSPDGNILASGSLDQTVKLWDVRTGKRLMTLIEHETWVWSVAFSPDGNILASSSPDGTVKLWDTSTGERKKTLNLFTGWLLSTAFSKDDQMFAASSQDLTIKLWDAESYELIKTFSGHQAGFIWSVDLSSNSQILASGSEDGTIKLWNIETGNCLNTLKAESLYKGLNIGETTGLSESIRLDLEKLGIASIN